MNVITVSRPPRKRNYHNSPSLNRARRARPGTDNKPEWRDLAEVLLFALIALISTWPVLAAVDAVVGLK